MLKPKPYPDRVEVEDKLWERFVSLMFNRKNRLSKEIRDHLFTLWQVACCCESVTEFGVKYGNSTTAFLAAGVNRLISVDLREQRQVEELRQLSGQTEFTFMNADCREIEIPPCDFLFIDSTHTGQHLEVELTLHASKVRRFLGFHDTVSAGRSGFFYRSKIQEVREAHGEASYGDRGWKTRGFGLMPVIEKFVEENQEWDVCVDDRRFNGLLILEKTK